MNAFISYSHQDSNMLDILHKHLTQLQRDNLIKTWTDREILAGGTVDAIITNALQSSELFIALLSPDYIASNYCYEKEFNTASQMQEAGQLIIIPVIVEPCDWLNTPFSKFKALPKDGKAISTWENNNTAFLDVIQNIRKLIESPSTSQGVSVELKSNTTSISRNYRVQKDFDSIEKLEFVQKTFHEVKEYLKRYIEEIIQLENIKARILVDDVHSFQALLVNRNKIASEAQLEVTVQQARSNLGSFLAVENEISYVLTQQRNPIRKTFALKNDEYQLFWSEGNHYFNRGIDQRFESKEIAEAIWKEWLESVGIL
jgi:hypothetical protein